MHGNEMKSSTPMLLVYDGPALEYHKISVEILAQSLTALNRLASLTNKTLFDDQSKVSLSVTSFKKGSFGVELVLDSSVFEAFVDALSGKYATAASNGIAIVSCLLEVLVLRKWLKGREITKIEPIRGTEQTKIYVGPESITVNNTTVVVFQNPAVKRDCDEFVSPLQADGITSIQLSNSKKVFELTAEEVANFTKEPDEQLLTENHVNVLVQVDSPNFKQDRKWRVTYNGQSIMVTVSDDDFLARVERHEETFGAGDILNCEMTIKQNLKEGVLSPSYEITRVVEHMAPPYQNTLPL